MSRLPERRKAKKRCDPSVRKGKYLTLVVTVVISLLSETTSAFATLG
jgi:hypothetical protein